MPLSTLSVFPFISRLGFGGSIPAVFMQHLNMRFICMNDLTGGHHFSAAVRIQLDMVAFSREICFDAISFSCRCGSTAFAYFYPEQLLDIPQFLK